jgi:hypothetical protein
MPPRSSPVARLCSTARHMVVPSARMRKGVPVGGVGRAQTPSTHASDAGQASPHAPQLRASKRVSTQAPPQEVSSSEQTVMQRPPEHAVPGMQASPQPPQLLRSVSGSTQRRPQARRPPPPHSVMQRPAVQVCSGEHTLPQTPQFVGSVPVSTQRTPQTRVAPGHGAAWQRPAAHRLSPQASPQAPQFPSSERVSTQRPLQSVWKSAHIDGRSGVTGRSGIAGTSGMPGASGSVVASPSPPSAGSRSTVRAPQPARRAAATNDRSTRAEGVRMAPAVVSRRVADTPGGGRAVGRVQRDLRRRSDEEEPASRDDRWRRAVASLAHARGLVRSAAVDRSGRSPRSPRSPRSRPVGRGRPSRA